MRLVHPRFTQIAALGLMLVLVRGATAADRVLFQHPANAADLKAWTLEPPVNALGPIPANGAWAAAPQGEIVATGSAPPWTIQTIGDPAWTDYALSLKVTIRQPAPKADFRVFHAEFDRYLPRSDYPPLCQHTGHYRYRYFAGEFDWGSDAAVLVRYQDRHNVYRVQLSTEYQEMILWHGTGGYLQVVPCELKPGTTYRLVVLAEGARLRVLLDGQKKIDYWHETLPTLAGRIGLAAYRAQVAFRDIVVTERPAPEASAPPHRAQFNLRKWRGLRWVFDGDEPILLLEKNPAEIESYLMKTLFYHFVKLRPGYRPLYFTFVGILPNNGPHCSQLEGAEDAIQAAGEDTDTLVLQFDTKTPENNLKAHHTDQITFDRLRGTYRHDMTVEVQFLAELQATHLEFCDPLTYNNKEPGRSVKYPWLPAGHAWGVLRGDDGRLFRHPLSQSLNLEGQNGWWTARDRSFWMLYPDRAVAPLWEHLTPGERCRLAVCHWGYDFHQSIQWDQPRTFKPNEKYTIRYALAGLLPAEAERLFLQSTLHPQNDRPDVPGKRLNFLLVPSPYAFAVCEPAGTDFTSLHNTRVPYVGWQFYGDYTIDPAVGHNDRQSLRLDGPSKVAGMIYHHMIDGYAKRYLCSLWLKTREVAGKGPTVQLRYPWGPEPGDVLPTGFTGDTDWQEVAWITTVPTITPKTYDASEIIITHNGLGTVWVDDFVLRPIGEGENVTERRPTPKPAPAVQVSADFLMHLRCDEGDSVGLYDASEHGNCAKMHGVAWVRTNWRKLIQFNGESAAFVPILSPELQPTAKNEYPRPELTLEAWVRPAAGKPGGAIIGCGSSPLMSLAPAGDKFTLSLSAVCAGKAFSVSSEPLIAGNQWSHVAAVLAGDGTVRLYVNGQPAGQKKMDAKFAYGAPGPMISIGTQGKMYGSNFVGEMAEIRWWARAANDKELATIAAAKQP